jgi:hypothetical protein
VVGAVEEVLAADEFAGAVESAAIDTDDGAARTPAKTRARSRCEVRGGMKQKREREWRCDNGGVR